MSVIDRNIIGHLARLSRISLTEEETEGFARDLGAIIAHASDLGKADTDAVPPMIGAAEMKNVTRPDEPIGGRIAFEPSFPETEGSRLKVPKIL